MPDPVRPRLSSISKTTEFRQVYRAGRLFKGGSVWLYAGRFSDGKTALGVSIPRAVDRRSTVRNRLKRIIREWFRLNIHSVGKGRFVVCVKKPAAQGAAGEALVRQELSSFFRMAP